VTRMPRNCEPMTVDEGRAVLRRVRVLTAIERAGLVVGLVGLVTFVISIVELTRIDAERLTGLPARVPYLAYTGIALFWGSMALVVIVRVMAAAGIRRLEAEQRRRDAEVIDAEIAVAEAASAVVEAGTASHDTLGAPSGATDTETSPEGTG
jgi:hypothetical protein